MDVSLSKLKELAMDREALRVAVRRVTENQTRLSNWTELNPYKLLGEDIERKLDIQILTGFWCSLGSIPGLGKSPGEGNRYPLQYSGPENSTDCIVHGVTNSQTRLSDFHFHFTFSLVLLNDMMYGICCKKRERLVWYISKTRLLMSWSLPTSW